MIPFANLTKHETDVLLKFPVYISLLAANNDGKLDEAEKKSAIKFSHIKTYSCDPLLTSFYEAADKVFEEDILHLDKYLPVRKVERTVVIKKELLDIEIIATKLEKEYSTAMHRSMKSFKWHVSNAHHNVLVDFIFPLPMDGLTD
ncbi:hypothetical protein BH11BAC3_BH11BAC3_37010 [soil metagenome]